MRLVPLIRSLPLPRWPSPLWCAAASQSRMNKPRLFINADRRRADASAILQSPGLPAVPQSFSVHELAGGLLPVSVVKDSEKPQLMDDDAKISTLFSDRGKHGCLRPARGGIIPPSH